MMTKILVTGSSGYIGRRTVEQLSAWASHPSQVIEFDLPDGDVLNPDNLDQVFRDNDVNAVLHLAALVSVAEGEESPGSYWATNVQGTVNVCEAMLRNGCHQIVLASSLAAQEPETVYGWTKWGAEQVLKDYADRFGFKATCLRYSNVAGGNHLSTSHLIPNMVRAALDRKPLNVTAPGICTRDFINVFDVARANMDFCLARLSGFRTYDICSGMPHQIQEVIAVATEVLFNHGLTLETTAAPRRKEPTIIVGNPRQAFLDVNFEAAESSLEAILISAIEEMGASK